MRVEGSLVESDLCFVFRIAGFMPRYRNPSGPVWLENWRYPRPPATSNFSTVLGFKIVAVKTRFPPYDTADVVEVGNPVPDPFPESKVVDSDERNVAEFLSSATTVSFLLDPPPATSGPESSPSGMVTAADYLHTALGAQVTTRNLSYTTVVLIITILLICTSLLTMYVIATTDALKDVIGHYLLSLAASDFLTGILVTPVALYASMTSGWHDVSHRTLCKAEVYLEIALYSTNAYVFMWIGVDRYAALKRPSRYEVEQTLTRCKCWIVFTWITAALLCCPSLFDDNHARYYRQTFLCILDWGRMAPYTVTLAVLVLAPSFITVVYSYAYILRKLYNSEDLDDNQKSILETDSSYIMTFFVVLFHFVSWTPWFGLKAYEAFILKHDVPSRPLHFSLLWLAIGGANWKIFIYTSMNVEFRNRLRDVFRNLVRCTGLRRRMMSTVDEDFERFVPSFGYANGEVKGVRL